MIHINFTKKQMWHIVFDLVLLAMILPACMSPEQYEEYKKEKQSEYQNEIQDECYLIDLTFEGETHQYVLYLHGEYTDHSRGSLSHWEGCKYCKEQKEKEKDNEFKIDEKSPSWFYD